MGVHWKIWFSGGGVRKKAINRGNCLKRQSWTVCRLKGGGGVRWKRGGGVFEGAWYSNVYYEVPTAPAILRAKMTFKTGNFYFK